MSDEIKEVECPHCEGTGKISKCPLCSGLGVVGRESDGGTFSAVPCPNGCPPYKVGGN